MINKQYGVIENNIIFIAILQISIKNSTKIYEEGLMLFMYGSGNIVIIVFGAIELMKSHKYTVPELAF